MERAIRWRFQTSVEASSALNKILSKKEFIDPKWAEKRRRVGDVGKGMIVEQPDRQMIETEEAIYKMQLRTAKRHWTLGPKASSGLISAASLQKRLRFLVA